MENWPKQPKEICGQDWSRIKSQERSLTHQEDKVISKHASTVPFMLDMELLSAVQRYSPAGQRQKPYETEQEDTETVTSVCKLKAKRSHVRLSLLVIPEAPSQDWILRRRTITSFIWHPLFLGTQA